MTNLIAQTVIDIGPNLTKILETTGAVILFLLFLWVMWRNT